MILMTYDEAVEDYTKLMAYLDTVINEKEFGSQMFSMSGCINEISTGEYAVDYSSILYSLHSVREYEAEEKINQYLNSIGVI